MTVLVYPHDGHGALMVLTDTQMLYTNCRASGSTNINIKNELKIPRTNPPIGERKNPIINATVNAGRMMARRSSLLFPPPPPGGRLNLLLLLYIERCVLECLNDDDEAFDDGFNEKGGCDIDENRYR
jgi:hypothetical protein